MRKASRGFIGGLLGAAAGFALTALVFTALALSDGTRASEAVGYGVLVGVAGAVVGGLIGLAVGAFDLGLLGGALAGVVATLVAVVFYVFGFGDPAFLSRSLRNSITIVMVLGPPAVLTGLLTAAVLQRRQYGRPAKDDGRR